MIELTAGELALGREPFVGSLPDLCTVQRYATTADGAGGYTEGWTADSAAVACRVAPRGTVAVEQTVAGRVGLVQQYVVTLAAGETVAAPDRIRWDTGGLVLQVVGTGGRSRELSRRIPCVEVV